MMLVALTLAMAGFSRISGALLLYVARYIRRQPMVV